MHYIEVHLSPLSRAGFSSVLQRVLACGAACSIANGINAVLLMASMLHDLYYRKTCGVSPKNMHALMPVSISQERRPHLQPEMVI